MNTSRLKINFSLATKNALSYFLLFLVTISLIGYFLLKSSSDEIISGEKNKLFHSSEIVNLRISKYLEDLSFDIKQLSKSPLLFRFLSVQSKLDKELLEQEYANVLYAKDHLSQIRFIGVEKNGKEIIRVERSNNQIKVTGLDSLQYKGDREYYRSTIKLPPDSLYVSKIDLNKEYGKISTPYTPTLRMSYPVFHDNEIKGIIVVNTDLTGLYNELVQMVDTTYKLSLINNDGYYLLNADRQNQFEFEFNKPSSFLKAFQKSPDSLLQDRPSTLISKGDYMHMFMKSNFPKNDYEVYILISSNNNTLLKNYFIWRNKGILIIIGLSLLSLVFAFLLLRRQVSDLKRITTEINEFSESFESTKLSEQRNDEIGVLASSFNKMSEDINSYVRALKSEKEKADIAVREKQEFIENMSHEIRNPIQSILGFSELLFINKHLPHQTALVKSIRSSTIHLQNLTNDILDYKKLIEGNVSLNLKFISLNELVNVLESIFSYSAMLKGIDLKFDIDQQIAGKQYLCDGTRINQILSNLIINAIKYTPRKGSIRVKVDIIDHQDQKEQLKFSIIDNGKGISDQEIKRIKDRYVGDNLTDSFGLGLSIVSNLLKLHNTQLEISSKANQGSIFSFILELEYSLKSIAPRQDTNKEVSLTRYNLDCLIIEDDIQIINYYQMILESEMNELHFCDHVDCINTKKDHYYDIAIVDYFIEKHTLPHFLPSVLRKLKDKTNLFVISAKPQSEINLDCEYIYIQKPFSKYDFKTAINQKLLSEDFQKPDFSSIYEDYDYNIKKINQALILLEKEWVVLRDEIIQAIDDNNQPEVEEKIHKMITSVRRIQLHDFEDILIDIQKKKKTLSAQLSDQIRVRMDFYLSEINDHLNKIPFNPDTN